MTPGRAAAALLAFCGCATVGPPQDGRPLLDALRFEGNAEVSSSDLAARIATTPSSGLLRRVWRTWDADVFEIDRQRLLRFYRARGFFEAQVGEPEVAPAAAGHVEVRVRLREGRRTTVSRLELEGAEALTAGERAATLDALPLWPGSAFDEELYQKSKAGLEARLKEDGFAAAAVEGEVRVSVAEALAEVRLRARPGRRYRFGKVVVAGNRAIPAATIVAASGLSRDLPFSPARLDLAQQRVYNLGVFSGVRVGLEPLGEGEVAAVRVGVREAPFQTIRVGAGLQLEEARVEIPRLRLEYTHRNFLGGVRRLELSTQAGYAFTPTIAAPQKTGITTDSSAQLTLPQLLPAGIDLSLRGEFAREIQAGFNYDVVAARTVLLFRAGKLSLAGSFNFVRTFAATLDLDLASLLLSGGSAAAVLSNCVPACSLLYPELRATFDARDDVVEPRAGLYASAGLARTLPGTSFDYWRLDPEVRFYLPLGGAVTLALRGQWGALMQPPGSAALATPFNQRFFGGGQAGMRGYGPQQQGPRLGAQPDAVGFAQGSVPVGGNGLLLASAELRVRTDWLLKSSVLVPFVDAGRVTDTWEQVFTGTPEFAPGLGLRYLTPFGPVRFDVAAVLNPQVVPAPVPGSAAGPAVASASCDAGAAHCLPLGRVSWHLTLGEAF